MAARRLPCLLPDLEREASLEVTRIHSIAGVLPPESGLVKRPPFRMPHHSASVEGILGGGKLLRPGEVSLAHHGVLFLDEAPEFGMSLLQGLREPVEDGWVSIARAGRTARYPAGLQLVLAFNPCPCGNLGRAGHPCLCSLTEIQRYWRRVGGALLDRIDLRVPMHPVQSADLCSSPDRDEDGRALQRVLRAVERQRSRHAGLGFDWNSRITPAFVDEICALDSAGRRELLSTAEDLAFSSRAVHSVLRTARTLADLDDVDGIGERHVREAIRNRRYGDEDFFWTSGRPPRSRRRCTPDGRG